jgi:hypothetical protein
MLLLMLLCTQAKVRENEANVKGLALEVAEAREQIDCLGFKRCAHCHAPKHIRDSAAVALCCTYPYAGKRLSCCLCTFAADCFCNLSASDGHGWSNVTGRPSNHRTLKLAKSV